MSNTKKWRITRRGFLLGLGATGITLAVGVRLGLPAVRLGIAQMLSDGSGGPPGGGDYPPTAWFEIHADNRIILHVPKVEMGQGIHTALAQIAAEELEIAWEQLNVVQASTARGLTDASGTGASNSVASLYMPLRQAAATMRYMLQLEAARLLNVSVDHLNAAAGTFTVRDQPDQSLTYGEIVRQVTAWEIPEEIPSLKAKNDFHTIGQSKARVDFLSKLTGQAVYGYDTRAEGMLYGAVARPLTIAGQLTKAEPGNALNRPGVVQVIIENGFAGVVAESRAAARDGVNNLVLEWDEGTRWQQIDLETMTTVGEGSPVIIQKEGDTKTALTNGDVVMAEYRTPMAAHAHLEPQAALVDVQPDRVRAWISTQAPDLMRGEIAKLLGRDEAEVEVQGTYLGGGFGRRLNVEAALEAARLSAAAGRPIHVGWDRTEEFRYGYFRPPTHHLLRGKLDERGRVQAIEHQLASGDVAFSLFPEFVASIMGADFGAYRGGTIPYAIPNRHTVSWRIKLPVRTGWWRGLGLLANIFAVESFMDELAHTAQIDPLAFRLQQLPEGELGERYRDVLTATADRAGWGTPLPEGRARGLACCVDARTVVAHVAEVAVEDGQIRVHKVTAGIDPGLIINPDGAAAQTEGNIVMGLSSTLFEQVTVKNGIIEPANFDLYPLITMKETPDIEVVLRESGETPYGLGEPPMGPIAAAVGNAVFALTGQRLRQLPLKLRD